jgi:hypothetical protein
MAKNALILILLVIVFILPFIVAKDIHLKFNPSSSPQNFNVEKGSFVDIPVTIVNQDSVSMTCTVAPSDSSIRSQITSLLNGGYSQTLYFRYSAPNKIKNLQSASITFSTDCQTMASSYTCVTASFPFFTTCYYTSTPFTHSVSVSYTLSQQDTQNLAIINNYRTALASQITKTDSDIKTLQDLMGKTAFFLQPSDSQNTYTRAQNNFNQLNVNFNKAVSYIEQEQYDLASQFTNPSTDLDNLNNVDSETLELTNTLTTNIQTYKDLVNSFNTEVTKSQDLIKPYSIKANSDVLDQYNSLTSTTKSKFDNYQFNSISDVQNTLDSYTVAYENYVSQLSDRESALISKGFSIIKEEVSSLCSLNSLCSTRDLLESQGNPSSSQQICELFEKAKEEVDSHNEPIYAGYLNELSKLSYKTQNMSQQESIGLIISMSKNISSQVSEIDSDIKSAVNNVNGAGKTINLSNYSFLVESYNNETFAGRWSLLKNLSEERDKIVNEKESLLSNENLFFSFFKKVYYFIFGSKQKVEEIKQGGLDNITETSGNFNNFYSNSCSSNDLTNGVANTPNIVVTSQHSDIKTQANDPSVTCLDENGQRTTNCCNGDSYKSRTDLYPVIFVHGHAAETGEKTAISSLATFNTMESYFAQNGYVVKDILYPEKINDLSKGVWSYCKPIAVRITYYEGVQNGGSVQYKSSIADYTPALSNDVDAVLKATNKNEAVIIAHSMGGILSRYYIKNDGGQNKIYKLITVSSPHYGARGILATLSYLPGVDAEAKEMQPGSTFLNNLNSPSDSLVDSYAIMGNSETCNIPAVACDGTLTVNSAKLKDGKSFFLFNGTQYVHGSIVNQQDVAQKILDIIKG